MESTWRPGSGDFGLAGNWTNGLPSIVGDVARFDGLAMLAPSVNLDRGAAVFQVIVHPEYRHSLGSPGNSLKWAGPGTGKRIIIRGGTSIDLQCSAGGVVVDRPNFGIESKCVLHGVFASVYSKDGAVSVGSDCDVTGVIATFGPNSRIDVAYLAAATGPTKWYCARGTIVTDRVILAGAGMEVASGRVHISRFFDTAATLEMFGGIVSYATGVDGGPVTAANARIWGGVLDLSGNATLQWNPLGIFVGPEGQVIPELSQQSSFVPGLDLSRDYP